MPWGWGRIVLIYLCHNMFIPFWLVLCDGGADSTVVRTRSLSGLFDESGFGEPKIDEALANKPRYPIPKLVCCNDKH